MKINYCLYTQTVRQMDGLCCYDDDIDDDEKQT